MTDTEPSQSGTAQALERARAAIEAGLRELEIDPAEVQESDTAWGISGESGRILVDLVELGGRPRMVVLARVAMLPLDNIPAFYRRLLELNRLDALGPSKLYVTDERVLICQAHLAESLDPVEVVAAILSLDGSAGACEDTLAREFPSQPTS